MDHVVQAANDAARHTHTTGMISSLRYLLEGISHSLPGWHIFLGRLGGLLRFKLVGTLYEAGKIRSIGMFFSESKALKKLEEHVIGFPNITEMAVPHALRPDCAKGIAGYLSSVYPNKPVYISRLRAATGMHDGPGSVAVAFVENHLPALLHLPFYSPDHI